MDVVSKAYYAYVLCRARPQSANLWKQRRGSLFVSSGIVVLFLLYVSSTKRKSLGTTSAT